MTEESINFSNELSKMEPFGIHNHTYMSNMRLRDAINKPEDLLEYCLKMNMPGVTITDHEVLSAHVMAHQYIEKNRDRFGDFQLSFGNEIYLVDRNEAEEARAKNEKVHYHHFILIAKNQNGYRGLKELSSLAWANAYFYKGMQRVPTYKDDLMRIMENYRGDIIATTACVGGELPQKLIKYHNNPTEENKLEIHYLITWLKGVFGENDLYFELQPSKNEDQIISNMMMEKVSKAYGIKMVVTTDAHYLNKEQQKAHEIYLKASNGEREVAEFYATTYIMNRQELLEYFEEDFLDELIKNTHHLMKTIEPITFAQETKIPKAHIPKFKLSNYLKSFYDKYEYIKKYSESEYEVDRYYLHLISEGMREKNEELNEENLSRINIELDELWNISERLKQPLSSYFVLTKELIDIVWEVSLVGVARGSASCFYVNYLLDIVQINPIKYELPHWRFMNKTKVEHADIDLDFEGAKREEIMRLTKEAYGEDSVLNMGTFTTEKTRSTVLTTCRGLGIDGDIAQNIANLIPKEKSGIWSIKDALYGNKEEKRKPSKEFIKEVDKYEGLIEAMLSIEGVVSGRGQHASGVIIYPNGYVEQNAMMKTTSGLPITQFDAKGSEFMGGLKLDFLSLSTLDRIRAAMDLLLKHKKIEWQGSLRATYNKYFHPDVLEMESPEMFKLLYEGHVLNAFQFESNVGQQTINKLNARTYEELVAANSLMRLSGDGEQPLDKFIRFKNDISEWHKELDENNLNEDEKELMKKHLNKTYGLTDSQEGLMELIMDKKISGYDLMWANKFRKAIAKQDQEEIKEQKTMFYNEGYKLGTRKELLDYVWEYQFKPSFSYAFSRPHTAAYTLILMIQLNICYRYGSIYWKTACLSVNSGLIGETVTGASYGEISRAVGDIKEDMVSPDINKSELGFVPDDKNNKILYGLKPIVGLGMEAINEILENRPFTSFDDFYTRMVQENKISVRKAIILIKAGVFDSLEPDRRKLMVQLVKNVVPKKDKLTMVQLPKVLHHIDQEKYKEELELYKFRMKHFGRNKQPFNKDSEKIFINKYSKDVEYSFDNGKLVLDEKSFNKYYQKRMKVLKDLLKEPEIVNKFNIEQMREYWIENCSGTVESWEMETILFYTNKHELDYYPLKEKYNVVNFKDMPQEPVITGYKQYRGKKFPQYKIDVIAGTVVEKLKGKNLVYILTQNGVVTVRYSKGQFNHYDKKVIQINGKEKTILDDSWFNRGTKLILVGFRRGDEWVLRKTGTIFNHTTYKLNGYKDGKFYIQSEKVEG